MLAGKRHKKTILPPYRLRRLFLLKKHLFFPAVNLVTYITESIPAWRSCWGCSLRRDYLPIPARAFRLRKALQAIVCIAARENFDILTEGWLITDKASPF
ncbi:hypothetical protein [Kalamiella sp. sgz302252]|uniref:hypothetical protein n=1 Tax=Pantoea sp. sgz302252 TaxID=3341827 RepID=UPI0036D3CD38